MMQQRLVNGNTEYAFSREAVKVTNSTILLNAQLFGVIPFGTQNGWQIVSVHDRDDRLLGFYAYNKARKLAASLEDFINSPNDDNGIKTSGGKIITNQFGGMISGQLNSSGTGTISINVNDINITGKTHQNLTEKVIKNPSGVYQVIHGASKTTFIGDDGDQTLLFGYLTYGAAIPIADLSVLFLK